MKKFLSLALALVMVLSLCACGDKNDKEPAASSPDKEVTEPSQRPSDSGSDVTGVTADELISSGYGVADLKSVTLDMTFTIREGSLSMNTHVLYEHDEHYAHLIADEQYDEAGNSNPMDYEFYYSFDDSTVYQRKDGDTVAGNADRYEMGISKLVTVPMGNICKNPVFEEGVEWYCVSGVSPASLVNDVLSFVYDDMPELKDDVNVTLFYDKENHQLTGMAWETAFDASNLYINAVVRDINNTVVVFDTSGDGADVPVDNEEDFIACDWENGEKYIAETLYGTSMVLDEEIPDKFGGQFPWLSDDELFEVKWFVNYYSPEGFARLLSEPFYPSEDEQTAAVIVCHLLGMQYTSLWENGYMEQSAAEDVIARIG